MPDKHLLTKREKQVMDVVYRLEQATVKEVLAEIEAAPSYSAIRAVMSRLETRGFLVCKEDGPRYVYRSAQNLETTRVSALKKLMNTFFDGSPLHTVNALLDLSAKDISRQQLKELESAIRKVREESENE